MLRMDLPGHDPAVTPQSAGLLPQVAYGVVEYTLLQEELQRDNPRLAWLGWVFSHDPGLFVRVLAFANARLPLPVASLPVALGLLGSAGLREALQGAIGRPCTDADRQPAVWQEWRSHCLHIAAVARSLATQIRCNEPLAYAAGMLYGVAAAYVPGPAGADPELAAAPAPLHRPDKGGLAGLDYLAASAWSASCLRRWRMPAQLVEAAEGVARPLAQASGAVRLAALLHLAVWRAATDHAPQRERLRVASYPAEVALALDLDMDQVLEQDPVRWQSGV